MRVIVRILTLGPAGALATGLTCSAGHAAEYGPVGTWPRPTYHLDQPEGAATDAEGNVYVADTANSRIMKFGAHGGMFVLGGPGTANGKFNKPSGVAVTPDGAHLYVADTGNHRVQKLTSAGTWVMSWGKPGGPDARGSGVKEFDGPKGVCVDSAGFVYVADTGNERVQKFSAAGVYQLQWGEPGSTNGQFYEPTGIAAAPNGDIYVVDHDRTNAHVQQFHADGQFVRTFGSGLFDQPWGIAIDSVGNVYVSDQTTIYPRQMRSFTETGTPVAEWGLKGYGDLIPFNGQPTMLGPTGVTLLGQPGRESLLVCDTNNDRLRQFAPDGEALGIRGSWGVAPERFNQVSGVAVDAEGNVFACSQSKGVAALENNHRAQKFSPAWELMSYTPTFTPAMPDVRNGWLNQATGAATDVLGNVYIAEAGNHRIQKLSPSLAYLTKWGEKGTAPDRFDSPGGVAVGVIGGSTRVFVADTNNNRILVFNHNGGWAIDAWGTLGSGSGQLRQPQGVAVAPNGIVYVVDTGNHRIQYFTSDGAYLGKRGAYGNDATHLKAPQGIAVSSLGEVFVSDTGNSRVKEFDADGTPVDAWGSPGSDPGEFRSPRGISVSPSGVVYVADTLNHRIQYFAQRTHAQVLVTRSASTVGYGGTLALTASLRDASGDLLVDRTLKVYRSYDGKSWSYIKSLSSSTGEYSYAEKLYRKTYFRFAFPGDEAFGSAEGKTYANAKAWLSKPAAPTTAYRGRSTVVTGYLKPRHSSGSRCVKLYGYRYEGGRWVRRVGVTVSVSNYSSYSKYRGSLVFPATGKWRVRAYHSDSNHAATYSDVDYLTVR